MADVEPNDPRRLAQDQERRREREQALLEASLDEPEAAAHERRAEKADYLRAKLEEQAGADQAGGDEA